MQKKQRGEFREEKKKKKVFLIWKVKKKKKIEKNLENVVCSFFPFSSQNNPASVCSLHGY